MRSHDSDIRHTADDIVARLNAENEAMTDPVQAEPVACPECGHAIGEESDLLTIAYMAGAYDERKARENAGQLRAIPTRLDLAGIEGLVEKVARTLAKADRIQICSDASYAMSSYGPKAQAAIAAILAALKEVDHG